jgi:hypothetical protein
VIRKLRKDEIRKIIQRSRRKHPIELSELRWKKTRGAGIDILSAPLDAYRLEDSSTPIYEHAIPIDGLWNSVLADLRDIQTKQLWPEFQQSLHDESKFAETLRAVADWKTPSPLMDIKEPPEIYAPHPLLSIPSAKYCARCGKFFFYFNRVSYHYCCEACRAKTRAASPSRKAAIARYVAAINEKRAEKRTGIKCGYCGALFDAKRASAKFCSSSCRVKNHYAQHQ